MVGGAGIFDRQVVESGLTADGVLRIENDLRWDSKVAV